MRLRDPISAPEVARMCGVTPQLVHYWRYKEHEDKPHAVRDGRLFFYEREEVEKFAKEFKADKAAKRAAPANQKRRRYYARKGK